MANCRKSLEKVANSNEIVLNPQTTEPLQAQQVRLLNQLDSECSLDGPSAMRSIHEWYEMN